MANQLRPRALLLLAVIGLAAMLGGCVAYPAYPAYGYGYGGPYYGGGYYGGPYVAYGGGWHGDGWHDGWRH
jgi:hypothetical protein